MKQYKIIKTQSNIVKHIPIVTNSKYKMSSHEMAKQQEHYIKQRINIADVSHLSKRDQQFYYDYQSKLVQALVMPQIITSKMKNYDVYHYTNTFKLKSYEVKDEQFKEYFSLLYNQTRQETESNRQDQNRKTMMFVAPEKSTTIMSSKYLPKTKSAADRLCAPNHYHGFILIHKTYADRFQRRAIVSGNEEEGLHLNRKITDPYSPMINRILYQNELLFSFTHKLIPLRTKKDVFNTCYYNNKDFLKTNFTYDDVLFFS